jgi:hypothetical protein
VSKTNIDSDITEKKNVLLAIFVATIDCRAALRMRSPALCLARGLVPRCMLDVQITSHIGLGIKAIL